LEICLGLTHWSLLRASSTKWLSLVALSGKKHPEVSYVLGEGLRQRGPCKTGGLAVTQSPGRICINCALLSSVLLSSCAWSHQHHEMSLLLQVYTLKKQIYILLLTGSIFVPESCTGHWHHVSSLQRKLYIIYSLLKTQLLKKRKKIH
jgi:hypothetical protein